MLRLSTETGYYLIRHVDHARLAGSFARHWGNELFAPPTPLTSVLHGIDVHDDGWIARDSSPSITRAGAPSAFSSALVGKYSAFEEIDLADYLRVRESAVEKVEAVDAYAALMVCMHTVNLLTERADRSTIAAADLPLLDAFLVRQAERELRLVDRIQQDEGYRKEDASPETIRNNFRLLQACDNLSLLSCVAYDQPATLLHPFTTSRGVTTVQVQALSERHFRLTPYPFDRDELEFAFPARHVRGHTFLSSEDLATSFEQAPVETLKVKMSA